MHIFNYQVERTGANISPAIGHVIAGIKDQLEKYKVNNSRIGIYLTTPDAGTREAICFWKDALQTTPEYANPANFAWVLPNAPAAYFAFLLNITGPVNTILSADDQSARAALKMDTDDCIIDLGILITIEMLNEKILKISGCILTD